MLCVFTFPLADTEIVENRDRIKSTIAPAELVNDGELPSNSKLKGIVRWNLTKAHPPVVDRQPHTTVNFGPHIVNK